MSEPRHLSVVMPCYNTAPRLLKEAVQSIDNERRLIEDQGAELSLTVVDDFSQSAETVQALSLLAADRQWMTVLRLERNSGEANARNIGVDVSASSLIAFLDSDDTWVPNGMARLFGFCQLNPTVQWISADFRYQFGDSPPEDKTFYPKHPKRFQHIRMAYSSRQPIRLTRPVAEFMDGSLCSMGACIIDRESIRRAGGFNRTLRKGVDTEFYWRLALKTDLAFAPWPVLNYRRHSASVTMDGGLLTDWAPPFLERMLASDEWAEYRSAIKSRLGTTLLEHVYHFRDHGQFRRAFTACRRLLALEPTNVEAWKNMLATLLLRR